MSSALGCPLGDDDVPLGLVIAGLSLGIEGAFGDGLVPCANKAVVTDAAVRITMSEREVFMLLILLRAPQDVKSGTATEGKRSTLNT
jgi:hypothetical protein